VCASPGQSRQAGFFPTTQLRPEWTVDRVDKVRLVNFREFLYFRSSAVRDLLPAMNVADSIWNKLTRVVIFLLLLAVLVGIGRWYLPLIRQNERMRKEIGQLLEKLEKEAATKKQLEAAIEGLNRSNAVARLIRNRLLYAKPDEIVVRFEEPVTNSSPPR
jgi:cell division protein FtsB